MGPMDTQPHDLAVAAASPVHLGQRARHRGARCLGLALVLALGWSSPAFALQRAFGWCQQGGNVVNTGGQASSTNVQQSFPSCTITVYLTGTNTLATIYSDDLQPNPTPKANPFTADATGYWFFYAVGRYDIRYTNGGISGSFTHGDVFLGGPPAGYADLRTFGAKCDGSTNVDPAVTAALAANYTRLYLPANCTWLLQTPAVSPVGWLIPANINILGEDLLTSKILTPDASNPANYVVLGARSTVEHVNLGGYGCYNGTGTPRRPANQPCPTFLINNQNASLNVQIFSLPYSYYFDSGSDPNSAGFGQNSTIYWSRGDGSGIFANYIGGQDNSAGSAATFAQGWPGPSSAAIYVLRTNDGPGVRIQDLAGAEGVAHTPTPALQFETAVRQHGNTMTFLQTTSNFDGTNIYMSNASGSGTFTGNYISAFNNGVTKFNVDHFGNTSIGGITSFASGAPVAAAATITATGGTFLVTGAGTIGVLNPPPALVLIGAFCLNLLPAAGATWTTTTGGNFAAASTAIPGRMLTECWEVSTGKYYPSY
jgi:hypothetical protein